MVSPRKSTSALSLIPEERGKLLPVSTKSCESLYSNTSSSKSSSNNLFRRKHTNGNAGAGAGVNMGRHATLIPATTEVRQRVLSARRLRMKTYQNQLADAQQTIADLAHENRILRTLHKRQDSALAKYESTNAELPKLLHSHAEEMRVWQAKYRNLQQVNKDLEHKLKAKESIILTLSDQNKYYSQLNKDRNLEERQRLSEKLEKLETRLQEKDNDMKLLARRVQIETKNFKQQILTEQKRTKEALLKLEKARLELSGYRKLDELGEKFTTLTIGRRTINPIEESKLEKDLERILADEVLEEDFTNTKSVIDEKNVETGFSSGSHRSTKSHINSKTETPIGCGSRKTASSTLAIGKPRMQRPEDGGYKSVIKQHQSQQRHQRKPQRKEDEAHERFAVITAYEDDYGNERDEFQEVSERHQSSRTGHKYVSTDGDDDESGDENREVKREEENGVNEDSSRKTDDEVVSHSTYNAEYLEEEEQELESLNDENGDNDDEGNVICNTAKKMSHMKEEISSIRKQISHDYKEREAFLDTFCRQANSGVLLDEKSKNRSNNLGHNLPSSRKNKLLAALKAIDDNKSQD